jgi:hypothetical protein
MTFLEIYSFSSGREDDRDAKAWWRDFLLDSVMGGHSILAMGIQI